MRRIVAVISAGLLLSLAAPALALDTLADARFESVRLTPNGGIRVVLEYRCPQGYQGVAGESWFYVEQMDYSDVPSFEEMIICDGNTQTLVRRFPPEGLQGQPWDPKRTVRVEMRLFVRATSDPERPLHAIESDTYSLHGLEEATRPGDIHITRVRMNDRGELVVAMAYRCPRGTFVDVENDNDWATITVLQGDGQVSYDVYTDVPLGDDISCDGTPKTLVKRFEGPRQVELSPDLPIALEALMITVNRQRTRGVSATDGIALNVP